MIGGLPPSNRPHWSRFEYGAFRSIFPCLPSDGFCTVRMLMLIGPLSLPSLTTDGRLLKMAKSCMSHHRERPPRGGWPYTCQLMKRVPTG